MALVSRTSSQHPKKNTFQKICQAVFGFGPKYRATYSRYVLLFDHISKFCFHCHTQILRPNSCATFMRHNTQEKLKNSHNDFQILFALQCYNVTCIFITYTITHVPLDKKTWQKTCCESLKCMLWEHAREEEVN